MRCCVPFGYGTTLPAVLPYAPPEQSSPTRVYAGGGDFSVTFADDEDWQILLPRESAMTGTGISVVGGRHGRIIGGHMGTGRLNVSEVTGSLFVEGLRWAMTAERDCIGVAGKAGFTPDWYFQNLYFGGVQGSSGTHADMIQWYDTGPVGGNAYFHNITGDTNYQGLKIDVYADVEPVGRFYLSNINLRARDDLSGTTNPVLYFLRNNDDVGDGMYPVPTVLDNCYAEPHATQDFQTIAWPTMGQTIGGVDAANFLNGDGSLSFPGFLQISGSIKPGQPPGGDFCPATAGYGYYSPGYR